MIMIDFLKVRQDAEDIKQEYLESRLKPVLLASFKNLCAWIPKRDIKVYFGNGNFVLEIQSKSNYSYTPLFDSYGNTNSYDDLPVKFKTRFDHLPLLKFMYVLDQMYDLDGYCLCSDNLIYKGV